MNTLDINKDNVVQIKEKISRISKKMNDSSWDSIVKYRDKGETANVYIKTDKSDKIQGLVVISFEEDGEASFVNIVGEIDLDTIGRLSEKFDVPGLDAVKSKDKDRGQK